MTDAKPSKSEKKREYLAMQALGEQLIGLTAEQLAGLETDEYLIEQVELAKKMRSHGALRRQKQLIGKIMRDVDPEPIRLALSRFGQGERVAKEIFKQAEQWRDRIAREHGRALNDFFAATGQNSKLLEDCLNDYSRSQDAERQRHFKRRIFKEVHRMLSAEMRGSGI